MASPTVSAGALLADQYEAIKPEIIGTVAAKLAASGVKMSSADLDASYNEAWHAVYLKLEAGEPVENHKGLLVTITHRRALSEYRAMHLGRRAGEEEISKIGVDVDLDERLDAEIQLRHFVEGLRSRLSPRELEAATLCHLHGFTRSEAAEALGIKRRRMEKIMDGASSQIRTVIGQVRAGEHCEDFSSMIRGFAVGLLDVGGERYLLAKDHLEGCPACRRQVMVLRGLAAITPPAPILLKLLIGSGVIGAGATSAAGVAGAPAGTGVATTAGGAAGGSGSGAGSAAAGGASAARKTVLISAGAVAAVAAVVAVVVATTGGGEPSPAKPPANASASASGGGAGSGGGGGSSDSASAQAAAAKAKVKAKAKAKAKAEAARRKKAERAARARAQAEAATPPPVIPDPVPPPEPVPDPVPPPPPPEPEPPAKPIRDAGVEFELH